MVTLLHGLHAPLTAKLQQRQHHLPLASLSPLHHHHPQPGTAGPTPPRPDTDRAALRRSGPVWGVWVQILASNHAREWCGGRTACAGWSVAGAWQRKVGKVGDQSFTVGLAARAAAAVHSGQGVGGLHCSAVCLSV